MGPSEFIGALLGSNLEAGNHCSLDGLGWQAAGEGTLRFAVRRIDASSLRLTAGPLVLQIGSVALQDVAGVLRLQEGRPRIESLQVESAELSGVKVEGPFQVTRQGKPGRAAADAAAWCLGPLASANGTIRAQIVDAHLLFDADVTVPIREGQIDFDDATVEHVGPDSRMGVSRLGLYVDAPNGRSYLYQFAAAAVDGVEFERRSALLGAWVTDRGRLHLQAFGEGLLRQGPAGAGQGFTVQARQLLGRTALSGEVRLGDGRFGVPGLQGELAGRAEGRNTVRLHSESVGRGISAQLAALRLRNAALHAGGAQASCEEISGSVALRAVAEPEQKVRLALELPQLALSRLRLSAPRG